MDTIETRKEYVQFERNDKPDPINNLGVLRLNGYQNFIKYFMSINTENDRILLIHSTGVGKTITSLSTSIDQMRSIGGNVFVMGFSKSVFKRELMARPEFGYVTRDESVLMKNLKSEIIKFNKPSDLAKLREFKRRVSVRMSGQITFIGYKALSSRLFVKLSSKANLDTVKSKEDIDFMISKRWIKLNYEFIKQLDLAFVICDEVHNLYSSSGLNSWGASLKYLMDAVNCKVMFLSATPVNNRPEKVVNVINLLSKKSFTVSDFFSKEKKLTQDGIDLIKKEIQGKVSFLVDRDISKFPSKEFVGTDIGFLKFVECKAGPLQEEQILKVMSEGDVDIDKEDEDMDDLYKITNKTPLEGKYRFLNDMIIPEESYRFYKQGDSYDGEILKKEYLKEYSSKYAKILDLLEEMVTGQRGKIFIYHNFVSGTGTSMIKNILEQNGIIQFGSYPSMDTRCANCYKPRQDHDTCVFSPLTYIYATGSVNKSELENNFELFNSFDNINGSKIKIVLGSQAIKESYDFKAVRNIIVAYMPDNISTLIQVLGRAIRKNSHADVDEKLVRIYLLVTALSKEESFEITKYKFKMEIFRSIKKINQLFAENAIDKEINYDINYPPSTVEDFMYDPPQVDRRGIDLSKLTSLYANSYFINDEVAVCKQIIKQFAASKYPTPFTFKEIKDYVRNPPYDYHRNMNLVEDYSIITAIEQLKISRIDTLSKASSIDLFSTNQSIPINGNAMYIKLLNDGIYVLVDVNTQNRVSPIDFYRPSRPKKQLININKIVNGPANQIIIRDSFIKSIKDTPIEDLDYIIDSVEPSIHLNSIIMIIEYFNDMWLRSSWEISPNHDTLVKLLFFYNKFRIIIFANMMDTDTADEYLLEFRDKIQRTKKGLYTSSDSHYKDYPSLVNSTNSAEEIYQEYSKIKYYNYNKYKNKFLPTEDKVKDKFIPIGHFFTMDIKILNSKRQWVTNNNFNKLTTLKSLYQDNKYVIGFLEKDKAGLYISFKLKLDNQKKEVIDSRKTISGSICETYEKDKLIEICEKLDIEYANRKAIMCDQIKMKLIQLEIKARRENSKIRYFKFYWE